MAALAIVEDLQILEDRVGQLHAGPPRLSVEELHLTRRALASGLRMTVGPAGRRAWMAMPRVLVTRVGAGRESMDQPTTLREKTSSTTAQ